MGSWSKTIASVFSLTCIWGSYEMYYYMRNAEALSLAAAGYAGLSIGCVILGVLVAKSAVEES